MVSEPSPDASNALRRFETYPRTDTSTLGGGAPVHIRSTILSSETTEPGSSSSKPNNARCFGPPKSIDPAGPTAATPPKPSSTGGSTLATRPGSHDTSHRLAMTTLRVPFGS